MWSIVLEMYILLYASPCKSLTLTEVNSETAPFGCTLATGWDSTPPCEEYSHYRLNSFFLLSREILPQLAAAAIQARWFPQKTYVGYPYIARALWSFYGRFLYIACSTSIALVRQTQAGAHALLFTVIKCGSVHAQQMSWDKKLCVRIYPNRLWFLQDLEYKAFSVLTSLWSHRNSRGQLRFLICFIFT